MTHRCGSTHLPVPHMSVPLSSSLSPSPHSATKEMACRWIRQGCIISLGRRGLTGVGPLPGVRHQNEMVNRRVADPTAVGDALPEPTEQSDFVVNPEVL